MTENELTALIAATEAKFNALTPEQQAEHMEAQRQSYVRADIAMDKMDRATTMRIAPRMTVDISNGPTEALIRRLMALEACTANEEAETLSQAADMIEALSARVEALENINAKLIVDMQNNGDGGFGCERCGAPLYADDDYVSDPDGTRGCWHAMTDRRSTRDRPCYAYRVGKPDARAALSRKETTEPQTQK